VTNLTADQARALLGGGGDLCGRDVLGGHDVLAGHASRRGTLLITRPRHLWPRLFGGQRERAARENRPGFGLVGTGAVLLVLLGAGLLTVSYAAQYRYVLAQRHQAVASVIEAGALDVGLIIFSLLALGLAMAGLASKTERVAVVLCALASAAMNYAAAEVTSPRSVLAFCMPPVFLAFVVDRAVSTVRRHVLGMRDGRSPWAALGDGAARLLRFLGLVTLYGLRFVLAAPSTCSGLRRAILAVTPLPEAAAARSAPAAGSAPLPAAARLRPFGPSGGRGGPTKTARFLELVRKRHGELAGIPLDQVSRIATAIAPQADLHPSTARRELLGAVRAALPAGEGGAR
jgi:hypothetical protein